MNNIGCLYYNGLGVAQDYTKAMAWFRKGAAAGSGWAMVGIGALYKDGLGVPQDYTKARYWFKRAERFGSPSLVKASRKMLSQMPAGGN